MSNIDRVETTEFQVALYEAYSSIQFVEFQEKFRLNEFVQPTAAQILQFETAQLPVSEAL